MKMPQVDFPTAQHRFHAQAKGREGQWSWRRWLVWITLTFAAQVALIFALGARHLPPPRAATSVLRLTLADRSNELLALNDPTLFALPRTKDFPPPALPDTPSLSFHWKEPVLPPLLATDRLGAAFTQFMRTNVFSPQSGSFKPEPALSEPTLAAPADFAGTSSLRIEDELARRTLLSPVSLTNWPYADVIPPSRVQVTVAPAGYVVSAVLLPSDDFGQSAGVKGYDPADQLALDIARQLRFAPGPDTTDGRLIFNWRTVPPPPAPPSVSP